MRVLVAVIFSMLVVIIVAAEAGNGVIVVNDPATVWGYSNLPPDGRERLLIDEGRHAAQRRAAFRQSFTQRELMAIVSEAALRHGIEPELLCGIAWTESRFRPYVSSPMGAQGLMQFMPATGRKFGIHDLMNPVESAEGGARYIRFLLAEYDGDLSLALAAYNAGTGAVKKGGEVPAFSETMNFVKSVLTMRDYFRNQ